MKMHKKAYGTYQEAQANELDQAQLILMMYRGSINFLNKALKVGVEDKIAMGNYISKAKNVILELMMSLNLEEGGEMGNILLRMYKRLFAKLNTAHMADDVSKVAEVRDSLQELEDAWRQVFKSEEYIKMKARRERPGVSACAR